MAGVNAENLCDLFCRCSACVPEAKNQPFLHAPELGDQDYYTKTLKWKIREYKLWSKIDIYYLSHVLDSTRKPSKIRMLWRLKRSKNGKPEFYESYGTELKRLSETVAKKALDGFDFIGIRKEL
jgi:hypothetical protein